MCLALSGYSQKDSIITTYKLQLEIAFPLNFGFGININRHQSNAQSEFSNAIVSANGKFYTQITFPALTFIFKNKYGFHTGVNFSTAGFDTDYMLEAMNAAEPQNYYYFTGKWSGGDSQAGSFSFVNFKLGFLYKLNAKKFSITPYSNFIFSIPKIPSFDFESKPIGSNYYSKHHVESSNKKSVGYELGLRFSITDLVGEEQMKHPNRRGFSVFSMFIVFGQHFSSGELNYTEKLFQPFSTEYTYTETFSKTNTYLNIGAAVNLGCLFK